MRPSSGAASAALLLLVLLLLAPATARAGTYTVDTCSPTGGTASGPGAWAGVFDGSGAADYDLNATCVPGPSLSPKDKTVPPLGRSSARLRFQAPTGALIKQATIWSFGYASDNTSGWTILAQDETDRGLPSQVFPGPQRCAFSEYSANGPSCSFGDPGGKGVAGRDFHQTGPIDTNRIEYVVACSKSDSCPGGVSRAGVTVYASRVTIEESAPPAPAIAGPLAQSAWTAGGDLTFGATDATGIRSARVLVDGAAVADVAGACRTDTPRPCDDLATRTAPVAVPEGPHEVALEVTDGAGNVARTTAAVRVDRTPPAVGLLAGKGRQVAVDAPDALSGLAGGRIEWATRGGAFQALETTRRGDQLRARLPRSRPAGLRLRVTATDTAGNAATFDSGLRASAGFGKRSRRVVYVGDGRGKVLTGRVRGADGSPVANLPVTITPTTLVRGATAAPTVTVRTAADGRFAYRAPAGFSRRLLVRVPPVGGQAGLTVPAALLVRAASSIKVRPARVSPGGRIRITGILRRRGATVPRGGKLLDLQGFERGRWRTFATARTDARGRWSFRYRFTSGARGTFPIRVRIRREAAYPFHVGSSRSVRVRVG